MECRSIVPKATTFREVIPYRLYMSAAKDVTLENISYFRITHIVNCTYSVPLYRRNSFNNSLRLAIRDTQDENIAPYFDRFYDHVCDILQDCDARILVHCKVGVSRSATLVISFLMKHEKMSLNEAFEYLLEKRRFICPNLGFWRQLRELDEQCFGKSSVEMIKYKDLELPEVVLKRRPKCWYLFSALATFRQQDKKRIRLEKKAAFNDQEDKGQKSKA